MKQEQKRFIIENIGKMPEKDIARELGIRERKVRKFIEGLDSSRIRESKRLPEALTAEDANLFAPKTRKKSSNLLIFLCITVIAFAVRLIYLTQIKDSPFFVPFYRGLDDYLYDAWAQSIAQGNIVGNEVFYGLPLYPYFLGFIYWFIGHSVYAAKFIQFFIGSVSCGLVFFIGQKVFNRYTGIIAGLIMALFSTAIFFEGFLTSAFLAIFLNAVVVLILLYAAEKPSVMKFLCAGLLTGISALANASILIFAVLVLIWTIFLMKTAAKNRGYIYAGVFLTAIIAGILPATIHNYIAAKEIVPITSHSGITFYAGNNPMSDGTYKLPPELGTNVEDTRKNAEILAERMTGEQLSASEVSDFWFKEAQAFMRARPGQYIRLLFSKMIMFWNAHEIPDILPMSFYKRYAPLLGMPLLDYILLSPLALLGIFLCLKYWKRPGVQLTLMFVLSVFISTIIYFVNSRYRLIALPYLSVFAGAAIWYTAEAVKTLSTRRILTVFAIFAVLFVFTNIKVIEHSQAQAHNSLGIILKRQGLKEEAVAEYKKAIDIQPNYPSPYYNLGLLYQEQGNNKEAITAFKGALEINPDFPRAHAKIGYSYYKMGAVREAKQHWRRSLELDPNQPDIRQMLGK